MKRTATLYNPQQAHADFSAAWEWAKGMLFAGHRLILEVRQEKRTDAQNAKFHALCADLARSQLPWAGKPRTAIQWKVLLVSGHATATNEGSDVVPGLEGEFINLRESTALMSKARGSSLIEYTVAFCASHGIEMRQEEEV